MFGTICSKEFEISLRREDVKMLGQLDEKPDGRGILLTQLIVLKLDENTQKEWEKHVVDNPESGYDELLTFLRNASRLLEAVSGNKNVQESSARKQPVKVLVNTASDTPKCRACDGTHLLYVCERFKSMASEEKIAFVKSRKLCWNCLAGGHLSRFCKSKRNCGICGKKHHSLLHQASEATSLFTNTTVDQQASAEPSTSGVNVTTLSSSEVRDSRNSYQLLSTALVRVRTGTGEWKIARALLDGGAQSCLMTEQLYNSLAISGQGADVCISVVGGKELKATRVVETDIASRYNEFRKGVSFIVVPKITSEQPLNTLQLSKLVIPRDLILADPGFFKCSGIDILLGQEVFYELHKTNQTIQFCEVDGLQFVLTQLGWVPFGQLGYCAQTKGVHSVLIGNSLTVAMKKFWQLEEVKEASKLTD